MYGLPRFSGHRNPSWKPCYNNSNNTQDEVLSSRPQGHCESSLGSFDECRTAPSGRRPSHLTRAVSPPVGCYHLQPPSPFTCRMCSVCTTWLHSTFRHTVSRRQQLPPGVFDPLSPADWLFRAPEQTMATAVSPSKDLVYGTVFLLHCEYQTLHWQRSGTNWRHFCLTCNCLYSAFAAF